MKFSAIRVGLVLQALQVCVLASNSVVNLSHYDLMRPDFAAMRQEGIVAAIHETTYPPFTRDERYAQRQQDAVRAGLLWGAYHYANDRDPIGQAEYFLRTVEHARAIASPGAKPSQVLLVLDFEKNKHYPGRTMRVDQAVAFVERIRERTGKYPGIYGGENHLRALMNAPTATSAQRAILGRCWLWVANYHVEPAAINPWGRWTMWQYTGDGVCDCRPRAEFPKSAANVRNAERNIFRGSAESVRAFWQEHGWSPGE